MYKPIRWLSVALAVVLTPAVLQSQEPQPPPSEVVDAFHAALARRDSAEALRLLAPEVLIFESGGAETSRDEFAAHHLGIDMEFAASTTRTVTDRTTGQAGDVAWVLSTSTTTGTFRGRAANTRGTETMMLRRRSDGWRITHIHWSSRRQQS